MAKEKTNYQKIEEIVNKVDDLRHMWIMLSNSNDDITPAMNCVNRLLFDIEKDLVDVMEKLQ